MCGRSTEGCCAMAFLFEDPSVAFEAHLWRSGSVRHVRAFTNVVSLGRAVREGEET